MKKLLSILFIILLIISEYATPIVVLAQEATSSGSITPSVTPALDSSESTPVGTSSAKESLVLDDIFKKNSSSTPSPSFLNPSGVPSARFKIGTIIRSLKRKSFRGNEQIKVDVDNAENTNVKARVLDSDGRETDFEVFTLAQGARKEVIVKPPLHLKPGKYTIEVTAGGNTSTQDFTWGVLAVNTNKSIYLPKESAKLAMAVLNEKGNMACDANVQLEIKDPEGKIESLTTENGKIKISPQCQSYDLTLVPDYEAFYEVGGVGIYEISLSAQTQNGSYTITDSFEVRDSVPFDVERVTPTRIFPPNTIPVDFRIIANQDFKGTVVELVPGSFVINPSSSSKVPYKELKTVSETAVENVLGASDSAKLDLPYKDFFPINLEFGQSLRIGPEKNLYAQFNLAGHDGIDFDLPEGTPVLAVDDGKVILGGVGDYGITVVLEHSWGKSYYGHLSKAEVSLNQEIKKGEEIALSGNTGITTGPHLHFGIKPNAPDVKNGYYGKIDPLPFLGLESNLDPENGLKLIYWDIDVKKGEAINLGYTYLAPNVSPDFYKLGPLKFYNNNQKLFEEGRQWQIAVDGPANQFVKTGSFTKPASTGSQSIVSVGFKPAAIIFYWTSQTAEGTLAPGYGAGASFGMGFATGSSNEAAISTWAESQDASGPDGATDTGRIDYDNASIAIQTTDGTVVGLADFTSFDDTGFTLNWSNAGLGSAYIIHYYAFRDSIISNATVNTFATGTGTGTLSVTNAGFQPDFVLFISAKNATQGTNAATGFWDIGVASGPTSEWTLAGSLLDAVDSPSRCTSNITDASLLMLTANACLNPVIDFQADFTQFTSTGFDVNISNAATSDFDYFYLALKGNGTSFTTGSFNKPTSAGLSSVTGLSFKPTGVFIGGALQIADPDSIVSGTAGLVGLGAASSPGMESAISEGGSNAAEDDSIVQMRTSTSKIVSAVETDDGTLTGEADLVSFDDAGFTLDWTTADATADQFTFWAIGEKTFINTELMRHGRWFNNEKLQPFTF